MGAITSGKILVNTPEWYAGLETPEAATVKDFMEYLAGQLAGKLGTAEYTEIINGNRIYPAVKIPWADGTIGTEIFALIIIEADRSTLISKISGTFKIGVSTRESYSAGDSGYYIYERGSSANNTHGSFNFAGSRVLFMINEMFSGGESFYTIGWSGLSNSQIVDNTYLAPTTFVCTLENVVTRLKHNAVIFSAPYTSGAISAITENGGRIETSSIGCPLYTSDPNIALVERLVFGRYYSNIFYVVYPAKHAPVSALLAGNALERYPNGWVPGLLYVKNHSYYLQVTMGSCAKALAVRADGGDG